MRRTPAIALGPAASASPRLRRISCGSCGCAAARAFGVAGRSTARPDRAVARPPGSLAPCGRGRAARRPAPLSFIRLYARRRMPRALGRGLMEAYPRSGLRFHLRQGSGGQAATPDGRCPTPPSSFTARAPKLFFFAAKGRRPSRGQE